MDLPYEMILFNFGKFSKEDIEVITGIILFLTLLMIIWYSYETKKLRLANEKF